MTFAPASRVQASGTGIMARASRLRRGGKGKTRILALARGVAALICALLLLGGLALAPTARAVAADPPALPIVPILPVSGTPPVNAASPAAQGSRAISPRVADPAFAVAFNVASPQTYNPAHTVFNATTTLTTTAYSNASSVTLRTYINVSISSPKAINIASAASPCPTLTGFNIPNTVAYAVVLSSLAANTTCSMTAQITLGNAGTYSFAPDLANSDQTAQLASGTPVPFVINSASTSTTLVSSSVNPSTYGQAVTFTATVTDGSNGNVPLPDGETVSFLDGTTVLGAGTTGGGTGTATFTTNLLTSGTHSITASYAGSTNYLTSTSAALTQTVNNPQGPTITVTFAPVGPITAGTSDTATVTITAGSTDLYFDTVSASFAPGGFNLSITPTATNCFIVGSGTTTASAFTVSINAATPRHLTPGSSCTVIAPAATPDPGTYTASVIAGQNGGTVATGNGTLVVGLTAPTLLDAIPGVGQVTLDWNAVTGATAYTVGRSTDGGTTFPGIPGTTYTDTTVTNGTPYTYRVVATAGAVIGLPSNPLTATPLAFHANDDAYTTIVSTTLTVPAPGVLGNDTSPFGPLSVDPTTVTQPAHGAASVNGDGSFTYTPAPGFVGTDSFTYQAMNAFVAASPGPAAAKPRLSADTNTATVTITVTPAPVDLGATLTASAPGVVAGNTATLTAVFTNTGAHSTTAITTATVTLSANAQFTMGAPVENGTAPASLTYSGGGTVATLTFAPGVLSNASIGLPVRALTPATAPTLTATATITAGASDTDTNPVNNTATATITVTAATVQSLVTTGTGPSGSGGGVTLSPGAATMRAGTNVTLATVATYTDGTHSNATDLTYSGYNAKVVSVSTSGVVTALGAGTTLVTITAPNGVTTTFTITVTDGSGSGLMAPAPQPMAKPGNVVIAAPGVTVAPQPTRKADAPPVSGVQPAVTAPSATPNAQPARH